MFALLITTVICTTFINGEEFDNILTIRGYGDNYENEGEASDVKLNPVEFSDQEQDEELWRTKLIVSMFTATVREDLLWQKHTSYFSLCICGLFPHNLCPLDYTMQIRNTY